MGERSAHWDGVYREKTADGMSWHQPRPEPSLSLLTEALPDPRSRIVDVGGGTSLLVDGLLERGYRRPAVLDVSAVALERARERLGTRADEVEWIHGDVTRWRPEGIWDGWHDRAVLHFLVDEEERERYRSVLDRATHPDSVAVIATFGPEGPTRCSGLPCRRCSVAEIEEWLGDRWRLEKSALVEHRTPWESPQQFLFCTLRKPGEAPA
ncbi:MAG: methyltransferase domain-containing protein [Gemmatimonadetes bacterium]|nr:methyltransferase domain-containing protein [Gemmatimonadota bacterium]NIR78838.1 methyltransferase domain-containing protein [Gemmatimonadota bacterium]NIT87476.1 methyltransferase domain-containing protein [Gemmatimonadota bacterium]NIU31335.1 methyltransferase domain-containing protein [Gemmatimonadota bacterium]NIU36023.1 methyltransferase domain-containing protein [Gemmatimonadota bacterium]